MAVQYLTPQEVADRLRVTRRTVYAWLTSGKLRGQQIGKGWRIPAQALGTTMEQQKEWIDPLSPRERKERNRHAVSLLRKWQSEETSYDPQAWEQVMEALRQPRLEFQVDILERLNETDGS